MQRMTDIYSKIAELTKKEMEIRFTPVSAREKSFITQLRGLKSNLAKLKTELHLLKKEQVLKSIKEKK